MPKAGAGNPDVHAVQMGAVVEVQRAPDPVHAPPVAHTPGVIALAGNRVDAVADVVDGDRARDRARDLVTRRQAGTCMAMPSVAHTKFIVISTGVPGSPRNNADGSG